MSNMRSVWTNPANYVRDAAELLERKRGRLPEHVSAVYEGRTLRGRRRMNAAGALLPIWRDVKASREGALRHPSLPADRTQSAAASYVCDHVKLRPHRRADVVRVNGPAALQKAQRRQRDVIGRVLSRPISYCFIGHLPSGLYREAYEIHGILQRSQGPREAPAYNPRIGLMPWLDQPADGAGANSAPNGGANRPTPIARMMIIA